MLIHIISNPVAGGGQGRVRAEALHTMLKTKGIEARLLLTARAGDARQMASEADNADCVAVVGGDGTLNEVVNGIPRAGMRLAVLPAGSANVVAREFGIRPVPERVAEWIVDGRGRPMDLLESEGRRIILGAGAGLDAAIATEVKAGRGAKSSIYRWVLPGARTVWRYRYPGVRVTVDGKELCAHSPYVVVGNCRYSAGIFPATRRALIDDGMMDVIAIRKLSTWRMPGLIAGVWSAGFPDSANVAYAQGRETILEPANSEPVALQIDGDPAGHVPARFSMLPAFINMVTP